MPALTITHGNWIPPEGGGIGIFPIQTAFSSIWTPGSQFLECLGFIASIVKSSEVVVIANQPVESSKFTMLGESADLNKQGEQGSISLSKPLATIEDC